MGDYKFYPAVDETDAFPPEIRAKMADAQEMKDAFASKTSLAGKADVVNGLIPTAQIPSGALSNVLGTPSNPVTSATAARPSGLTVVYWRCATQPTNWVSGDVWTVA